MKFKCHDCKVLTDIDKLDSWATQEEQDEADCLLCKSCHDARYDRGMKSAWGRWCEV